MHLSQVDLNLFVVLEAIYREGNITRAGVQLNLTQPAISHALKRLRELMQDPLFVRQGAHMVPTPFTRNIIEEVRQALQILEVNLSQSRNFDPKNTRRNFHLALWEYAEALLLPPLLQRLTDAAPGMSITTSRVRRRDLETELASGSVDLAIEIPMTVSDRIRHKWLLNEQFVVMARHGHPAIKGKLDLDTYVGQRHVHISSRRHGPSLVDIELSRRGLRRNVVLRSQHNLTGCLVVSQTDMLLTLPERHAKLLNANLMNGASTGAPTTRLPRKNSSAARRNETRMNQVYPFPLAIPRLEAHLYWHESVENDPANRWLRQEIEDVLTAGERETASEGAGRARGRDAKKRGKAS
ncbi:MAG TPA: LysR family transcriptional regulator [Terriglobales bacterium]|nr:LysR family transcriptional regulator [Terriglobales bacterium]